MKRVVQTRTGDDGNCLNACIASILELPLKAVPEFGEDWQRDLNDFLATKGLRYRRVPMHARPSGYSTIEGVSPRGGLHACVALDGELAWDPHPIEDGTGQGLVEPRYYGLLEPLLGQTAKEKLDLCKVGVKDTVSRETLEKKLASVKKRYEDQHGRVGMAEERRKMKGQRIQSSAEQAARSKLRAMWSEVYSAEQALKNFGSATDRADMQRLRAKTEKQGGPFFIQETTRSGAERTIPVRELAKGADSKASEVFLLLAAIYAWYKTRKEAEAPIAYDLTKYVPRRRVFDSSINSYRMSDILDALGIDIKEYMRRTEAQKKALLKTALEKLTSK